MVGRAFRQTPVEFDGGARMVLRVARMIRSATVAKLASDQLVARVGDFFGGAGSVATDADRVAPFAVSLRWRSAFGPSDLGCREQKYGRN
jgi:hypothetical protein